MKTRKEECDFCDLCWTNSKTTRVNNLTVTARAGSLVLFDLGHAAHLSTGDACEACAQKFKAAIRKAIREFLDTKRQR